MAEYGREQRNQLSRVIANSGTGSRQLKGFVDQRMSTLQLVTVRRAIKETHKNSTSYSLRDKTKFETNLKYGIGNDGWSTFVNSNPITTPYYADFNIDNSANPTTGKLDGLNFYGHDTATIAAGHWSINSKVNWTPADDESAIDITPIINKIRTDAMIRKNPDNLQKTILDPDYSKL